MNVDPRTRHFGRFYGLSDVDALTGVDLPLVAVTGNCQAGSIRRLLESTGGADAVLIPPVHELTADDMPHLRRLLSRADVLVAQPVRDGYRGLPLGWREQAALLPAGATVARYPVLRWSGLHPHQVIVRPPRDTSATPPIVPYHDLRILLAAAAEMGPSVGVAGTMPDGSLLDGSLPDDALLHAARRSIEALRVREEAHDTVPVSDILEDFPRWHTINHPDNATLAVVARRVAAAAGIDGDVVAPEREMLGGLRARVDDAAARALGIDPDPPGPDWTIDGEPVDADELRSAHLQWYREHPDAVTAGLERHADLIAALFGDSANPAATPTSASAATGKDNA
ncbi:WcbI family polysaccharide biosynthesis putative acetyltransferase [uncultured Corynebacterium sp.]|uniref:WcbI family polysaccharide biosynthesis putative acetyltransferase n=1 Tax=uncultured Corynebacterium sp. TaxID=159447 RepID=UPI0025CD03BC|nr:WcbI family polysaccharide biosynthesis putative acetyltransferase [uncultured Corynebacterium sp.]